jgi:hypothetical protein
MTNLLDTITDAFDPNGGLVIANNSFLPTPTKSQSDAISFSIASAQTITSIEAFIASPTGPGSVNLGIMASVGGLPSGTFLDISTASLVFHQPVSISNLSWTLLTVGSNYSVNGGLLNHGSIGKYAISTSATVLTHGLYQLTWILRLIEGVAVSAAALKMFVVASLNLPWGSAGASGSNLGKPIMPLALSSIRRALVVRSTPRLLDDGADGARVRLVSSTIARSGFGLAA